MKKEAREGYKMTELGEIPNEWTIDFIKNITIEHKQGYYSKSEYDNCGTYLMRITDLRNHKIDFSEMPKIRVSKEVYQQYKLELGDFLFARSGTIGRYGIYNKEIYPKAIFASYIIKFKFNENLINNSYLGYFYESSYCTNQLKAITQGSSNININANNIKSLKICLPNLKEQEKIAEILSTVDEQIENTEKLIQKNQELKKGLMQQLLTKGIGHTEFKKTEVGEIPKEWEVKKLDEIVEKERKITYGIVQPGEYTENGVHVIRAKDYSFGWVDNDEIFKTSDIIEKSYTRSRVKTGDLLLTIVGSVGNLAIVPLRLNEANITQQTARIAIDNNIYNSKFYYYYLESEKAKKEINKYLKSGVQPSLNLSDVNKFKIVVPLLEEQKKISRILSGLDEKLEEYKNKKEKLKEVKIGLIQQLLVGRIRVS